MSSLTRAFGFPADMRGRLEAIDKVQAVIDFRPDGTILHANSLFLQTMGYRLEEIVGKHHRLFCDDEYAVSDSYRSFWQSLNEGKNDSGLYQRIAKDGTTVWLQSSYNPIVRGGKVLKVVKYATNVTAQRAASADMDGRLKAIDRSQGVIEFSLDGHILTANANFLKAVGYPLEEVVGQHHSIFVEPSERQSEAYLNFWARLRAGIHDAALYRRYGKGGREVWIQATYNPILDANDRPIKVVKYATDITPQTHAAQTLQTEVVGLSATVLDNARKAAQANQMAVTARNTAERGGAVVSDVVRTMRSIRYSTDSVSEIVALIDSLTFQTNILALNAAIEAAHAGEAGKGFAVVADEVRNLAARSKEAARQINALITAAGDRVTEGSAYVESAGDAMNDILISVNQVSGIVSDISESATMQAHGIERVHSAVAQLETVYGQRGA